MRQTARRLCTLAFLLAAFGTASAGSAATKTTNPVMSLNGQSGAVTLVPGPNINISAGNGLITIGAALLGGGAQAIQEITGAGSHPFLVPAGVTHVWVILWGGGGGGGGGGEAYTDGADLGLDGFGGGGGSAGVLSMSILSVTPGSTYSVVLGAGGTAGSAGAPDGGDGGAGGDSQFLSPSSSVLMLAGGGKAGKPGLSAVTCADQFNYPCPTLSSGTATSGIGSILRDGALGSGAGTGVSGGSGGVPATGLLDPIGGAGGSGGRGGHFFGQGQTSPTTAGGAGKDGYAIVIY